MLDAVDDAAYQPMTLITETERHKPFVVAALNSSAGRPIPQAGAMRLEPLDLPGQGRVPMRTSDRAHSKD
jgi:hypothetical protein